MFSKAAGRLRGFLSRMLDLDVTSNVRERRGIAKFYSVILIRFATRDEETGDIFAFHGASHKTRLVCKNVEHAQESERARTLHRATGMVVAQHFVSGAGYGSACRTLILGNAAASSKSTET
jgi:hypothetical protein